MKTISVIVPCYNCEEVIEACVDAILGSSQPPLEVILVDDCSTDGTGRRIEGLRRAHPNLVNPVTTDRNRGPAHARNKGAQAATGECLFFLDSDTEVLPDTLANFADRIEDYDAVVGMYDEEPLNPGPSQRYKPVLYVYLVGQQGVQPFDHFSASCAGIRASVFRELSGYEEWFPPGLDFENEELGHRIADRYRMVLDPSVRARHRFPGHRDMARTFFQRTALWVEMFTVRRKFSPISHTRKTGLSSMALLGAVVLLPLVALHPLGFAPSLAAYLVYLYGYLGFFAFVLRRRPGYLPTAVALNMYYTLIIACGAVAGFIKVLTGTSRIAKRFAPSRT